MAADLNAIRTKIRRLTRTPSEAQMDNATLDDYINTFVLYDFPEHLRTFILKEVFSFTLNPLQDTYDLDAEYAVGDPLDDLLNAIITIHPPVYCNGYEIYFTQSQKEFYGLYPKIRTNTQIGVGDGATTNFAGTLPTSGGSIPILMNEVTVSAYGANLQSVALADAPVVDAVSKYPIGIGNLVTSDAYPADPPEVVDANNNINYQTGAYTINFGSAPTAGQVVEIQYHPLALDRPRVMLYYGNSISFRPVPDRPYDVTFDVFYQPAELLDAGDTPQLAEWWQYIAYGAAKKIFEDRMDMESVAAIMPEFKKQEALCNRRTIVQLSNQRPATIYAQADTGRGGGWNAGGPF